MDVTPLRVLIVITKANWGGAQKYVYTLAKATLEAKYEVTVAYGTPGELLVHLEKLGVHTIHVPELTRDVKGGGDIRALNSLKKIMRALRPDVVHTNSSKAGILAALAASMVGVKRTIFTAHGWAFNEKRPVWQIVPIALIHFLTVLLSDITICVSDAIKRDAKWMPFVQKRLVTIHNGIPNNPLLERSVARKMFSKEQTSVPWICAVAELHPTKQIPIAIAAFSKIAEEFPLVEFFIIGDGEQRTVIENLVAEYGLKQRVHVYGHLQDAPQYLSAFDIFVLPSRSEALGYVILEAGMAKLPVVASRVGGIPEIITDRKEGLLVESGNVLQLADALKELISRPDLRMQFGNALYEKVTRDFSEKEMIEKTLSLYLR